MPVARRIEALLAKVESVYGTDAAPSNTLDAVRLADHVWSTLTPDYAWLNTRENVMNGSLVPPPPAVPRGRIVSFDFTWEIKGSRSGGAYAAGNKSDGSALLRMSSMAEATNFGGGVEALTYTHADSAHDSCTLWIYSGGYLFKLVGCRAVWSWPIGVGVLGSIRFRGQGLLTTAPAAASIPVATYPVPQPLAGVGLACTIGGWTPDGLLTAEIDQAARLDRLDSANASDGIQSFDVGDTVQPVLRLSTKVVAQGTEDPYAILLARTIQAIAITYNTAVQYDRLKFTANGYLNSARHIDQGAWTAYTLEYLLDSTYQIKLD